MPEVELVGDLYHILTRLGEECRGTCRTRAVRNGCGGRAAISTPPRTTTSSRCSRRALYEIRKALGREDVLISDGSAQALIGRMFLAYEPNTVLIANGLAGMGFAVPGAVAAKLVHPTATW